MLYQTSRYADPASTRDVALVRPDGAQVRALFRTPGNQTGARFGTYVWRAGDRLDRVAKDFLGDPSKFWKILDINPEIGNPANISPGLTLRIPQ